MEGFFSMHRLIKFVKLLFVVFAMMILFMSLFTITAGAENDPLYIVIDISNKTYDGNVISYSIEYYSDEGLTNPVTVTGTTTVEFFLASDTGFTTPFSAPTDAGSYVARASYSEAEEPYEYQASVETQPFSINKRTINFSMTGTSIYGNSPSWNYALTVGTFASGESFGDLDINFTNIESNVNAGTYHGSSSSIGNTNYTAGINWSLNIAKKSITVGAPAIDITYGNSFAIEPTVTTGILSYDDEISDLNLNIFINGNSFIDEDLSIYNAGNYTISATYSNNNYLLTYTNSSLIIRKYYANINIISAACVYGTDVTVDRPFDENEAIFETELTNSLAYDDLYTDLGVIYYVDNEKPQVGSFHRILTVNSNLNYIIVLNVAYLVVTPREMSATIDNKTYVYGQTPVYTLTLTEGSYASGDNINSLQAVFAGGDREASETPYTITAVAHSSNYVVIFTDGELIVTKRSLIISVSNINITYGDLKTFQCSLPAGQSLPYMDSLAMLNIIITSTENNVGTYQAGITYTNDNYNITFQGGQYTIAKKSIEIKIDDVSIIYGNAPVYTCSLWNGSFVDGDDITDLNISYTPESLNFGDRYIISGSYNNPNYNVSFRDGRIDIAKRAITVIINNVTVTYGDSPTFTYQLAEGSTLAPVDTLLSLHIVCSSSGVNVIDAPIQIAKSYNNSNYDITFINGTHLIVQRDLTIQVNDITKEYRDDINFDASDIEIISGSLKLGDTLNGLALSFGSVGSVVGEYVLTVDTNNSTYNVTVLAGTLKITKCKVHIEVEDIIKTYGDRDQEIEYTCDTEDVLFTGSLDREPGEAAGTYEILIGTLTAGDNYQLILSSATLTIDNTLKPISYAGLGMLGISLIGAVFLIIRRIMGAIII